MLPTSQARFSLASAGGARNHQNLNKGASLRSAYSLYRGRGTMGVLASGGIVHGATRTRGKMYRRLTKAAAAIGNGIPVFGLTETTPQVLSDTSDFFSEEPAQEFETPATLSLFS
ncbi:hypothetical protein MTO96_042724 [Rhipicephalus appendiculatus]